MLLPLALPEAAGLLPQGLPAAELLPLAVLPLAEVLLPPALPAAAVLPQAVLPLAVVLPPANRKYCCLEQIYF